ncbi:hypothetical protein FDG2_1904 [Candidatus Protofrankia californiensis]|uniref:Uncharacterized protein n=1 Tax=Candidatus Protofrankia californiensis TaxID=1839754 RepID=A0A1C3NWL1_9ACTN|nr:hypothetical protein FDG2_1904 [Candidatus Protofrankia californiensis]
MAAIRPPVVTPPLAAQLIAGRVVAILGAARSEAGTP